MPQVTIIIAIYNVARYLPGCLESVLHQTFSDIEILAINDGSEDNSLEIIKTYAARDSRIEIIDKPNGGLSDARNAGMKVAAGKYLAFLDGDDLLERDFVAKMLGKAKEGDYDLVCCNYSYVWEDGRKPVEKDFLKPLPKELNTQQALSAFFRQEIIGSVAIKFFKREICEWYSLRFPTGQNWEDITFTFTYIGYCRKVGILNESLYLYLQMENSITRRKDSLAILDIMKASEGVVRLSDELYLGCYEKEKKALLTRSFICLLVYTFKCRDKEISQRLKKELKQKNKNTSIELLDRKEKALILLYRTNYHLARSVYFNLYKRNEKA